VDEVRCHSHGSTTLQQSTNAGLEAAAQAVAGPSSSTTGGQHQQPQPRGVARSPWARTGPKEGEGASKKPAAPIIDSLVVEAQTDFNEHGRSAERGHYFGPWSSTRRDRSTNKPKPKRVPPSPSRRRVRDVCELFGRGFRDAETLTQWSPYDGRTFDAPRDDSSKKVYTTKGASHTQQDVRTTRPRQEERSDSQPDDPRLVVRRVRQDVRTLPGREERHQTG